LGSTRTIAFCPLSVIHGAPSDDHAMRRRALAEWDFLDLAGLSNEDAEFAGALRGEIHRSARCRRGCDVVWMRAVSDLEIYGRGSFASVAGAAEASAPNATTASRNGDVRMNRRYRMNLSFVDFERLATSESHRPRSRSKVG